MFCSFQHNSHICAALNVTFLQCLFLCCTKNSLAHAETIANRGCLLYSLLLDMMMHQRMNDMVISSPPLPSDRRDPRDQHSRDPRDRSRDRNRRDRHYSSAAPSHPPTNTKSAKSSYQHNAFNSPPLSPPSSHNRHSPPPPQHPMHSQQQQQHRMQQGSSHHRDPYYHSGQSRHHNPSRDSSNLQHQQMPSKQNGHAKQR